MRVRELAPGKLNLALFLGGLRGDGRHELVTVIESVSLADELDVSTLPDGGADEVICDGVTGENLVATALVALRARGWSGPSLRVEINKRIPVAAGMGGGSADAAAILRVAERLAPLAGAAAGPAAELAAELGADVPSQLAPGLVLGRGAGDEVEPRPALAEHAVVIVPQPHQLSTARVYAEADRLGLPRADHELEAKLLALRSALVGGERLPDELLVNDLEPAAVSLCPEVAAALDAIRDAGADNALVCGSGPTVAGVCWGEDAADRASSIAARIDGRFPGAKAAWPVSSPASGTIVD
jgi:4-diphosphocytidyl-2-C-methyl-D-erythritol kinase